MMYVKYLTSHLLLFVLASTLVAAGFFNIALAQPSYTINYQGKLTTPTGVAIADGAYTMEFKLYTVASGGIAVWTETRSGANQVVVQNGLFSVMLGDVTSLASVNFNQPLYLGVNINSDGEMTPRKAIGTVPSAFEAKQLGGVASSSFLRSDQADVAGALLTFNGGLISNSSSTLARLSFTNATGTSLFIGGDRITDFVGTGLTLSGTTLTASLGADITAAEIANGDHGFFSYTTGVASLDTGGLTSNNLLTALSDETGTGVAVFGTSPTFTTNISLGTAGVRLSDDGDGAITFLGLGNGSDEDLTLNLDDTANTGVFTSSTGLNLLNFSSIGLQESGSNVLSVGDLDTCAEFAALGALETGTCGSVVLSGSPTITTPTFTTSANFGTAGVRLSDDGDGAITFLGLGNGFDENLILNFDDIDNAIYASSTTGVNTFVFNGITPSIINFDETGQHINGYTSAITQTSGSGFQTGQNIGAGVTVTGGDYQVKGQDITVSIEDSGAGLTEVWGTYILTGIGNNEADITYGQQIAAQSLSGTVYGLFVDAYVGPGGSAYAAIFNNGNVGIGTTTPSSDLTVAGDLYVTGAFRDSSGDAGTNGQVLLSTLTGTNWVATSSLGFAAGFAATDIDTSAELAAILGDETGSGALVFGTSPTLTTPNLGTPSALTLTNATGLPISGITGLGAGVGTWLATPSSSNLRSALTDETGTGLLVFNNEPTFIDTGGVGGGTITLGPSGMTISTDGDGAISFFGLGDGNDENLTLNLDDTANTGVFTSASGLNVINFSGIALQESGSNILSVGDVDTSSELAAILGDETGNGPGGVAVFSSGPTFLSSITTPLIYGGTAASSQLILRSTSGSGTTDDIIMGIGTNGATQAFRIDNQNRSITFGANAGATFNSNTTNNVAIGSEAGRYASTSGTSYNNYIGYHTGHSDTGYQNNFIGREAGYFNTGQDNNFIGWQAGYINTGSYNNFIGVSAGQHNTGNYNQFIGNQTGQWLQSTNTVAIGAESLFGSHFTTYISNNNVALGYRAGYASNDGSGNNILIGYQAADNLTTGNNNIIIGYDIDNVTATADNRLNIGNLIFGTGLDGTGTTIAGGNIGIGISNPTAKFHIQNDISGTIFQIDGDNTALIVDENGNVGIGTTTPSSELTVDGDIRVTGAFRDTSGDAGVNGQVLLSTLTGTNWTATSTLGLGNGSFLGLNDTFNSYTTGRIPYSSNTALIDSSNFTFDGTRLAVGGVPGGSISGSGFVVSRNSPAFGYSVSPLASIHNRETTTSAGFSTGFSVNMEAAPTGNTARTYYGSLSAVLGTPSAERDLGLLAGSVGIVNVGQTNPTQAVGVMGQTDVNNALATVPIAVGVSGVVVASAGSATQIIGLTSELYVEGATVGDAIGVYIPRNIVTSGSLDTSIGLLMGPQDNGTENWNLYIQGATTNNYIAGNLGLGTTSPSQQLTVGATTSSQFLVSSAGVISDGTWQGDVIGDTYINDTLTIGAGSTFANNIITPNSILTTGQTDEYCLTYEGTGTTFEWQTCGGGGGLTSSDIDTSSELAAIVGDETGSGALVFGTAPTFTTSITSPLIYGGTVGSSQLILRSTSAGIGATTDDIIMGIGTNGTTQAFRIDNENDSVMLGENAGATFTSGTIYNVAIGYEAGRYASTSLADYSNYIGYQAGYNNTGSTTNAFGNGAGFSNTGPDLNAFGRGAGRLNTGISVNAFGATAAFQNSGSWVNAIGQNTATVNRGSFVNAMGINAAYGNYGNDVNAFGGGAASDNRGSSVNALGQGAAYSNTGSYVNAIGTEAGYANTGNYNELMGYRTGRYLRSTSTVAIGAEALFGPGSNYTSLNNVALGYRAGYVSANGSGNNILIGYQAADNLTTGNNNIIIGYDIDNVTATADNRLNIGNLIFGTGLDGTGTTLSSGNIGIGTSSPLSKLHIAIPSSGTALTLSSGAANTFTDISTGVNNGLRIISGGNYATGPSFQMWPTGTTFQGIFFDAGSASGADIFFRASPVSANDSGLVVKQGTGRVGIGTASPGAALDVVGGILASTATLSSTFTLSGSAANIALGSNWLSGDGADEGIFVDGSGNVGVGTSTPASLFHVNGRGAFGNSVNTARLTNGLGPRALSLIDTTGVMRVWRYATGDPALELISGTNDDPGNAANKWWDIAVINGTGSFTIRDRSGAGSGGTNPRLTINSSGNVGIGTTSPSQMLSVGISPGSQFLVSSAGVISDGTWQGDVIGDTYINDTLTIGAGSTFANNIITPNSILTTGQTDEYCLTYEGTGIPTFEWQTCGGGGGLASTDIDTSAELAAIVGDETGSGALVFSSSPTFGGGVPGSGEILLGSGGVKLTGNDGEITFLGLGAGSDEDLSLDLDSTSNTGVFTSSTGLNSISFSGIGLSATTGTFSSTFTLSGTAANIALGSNFLSGDGGDEGVSVDASGNVFTSGQLRVASGTASLPSITLAGDTDTGFFSTVANSLTYASNGIARFRFTNTGIVSETSNSFTLTSGFSASTPTYTFTNDTDTGIFRATTDTLGFATAATERLRIDASGNVGIGTTTPSQMLAVGATAGSQLLVSSAGIISDGTWQGDVIASAYLDAATILSTEIDTSSELAAIVGDETGTGALVFGTAPTFTTSITTPIIYGGTTGSSQLILRSTSGSGTTDDIIMGVGTNGATQAFRIDAQNNSITFGENAGTTFTSDTLNNIAIGYFAGQFASTTNSDNNAFIGVQAGQNSTGDYNNFIGSFVGSRNSGTNNNILGQSAGTFNSGSNNNILGQSAGYINTGSINNILGFNAGYNNTGSSNNFFGLQAGYNNTGSSNNIFGQLAGYGNTGSYNNLFGFNAGYNNTGSTTIMMGYRTGEFLRASSSVIIGGEAMRGTANFTAPNNVAIGQRAGYLATTGAWNNILIGYQAADNLTTGNNNIIIGYNIDNVTATADNRLNIGNLLFGTGLDGTGTTLSSGNIGIGTSTPGTQFAIDSTDGNISFGTSVFPGKTVTTDTGLQFSDTSRLRSGLFTEVDGDILSYAINTQQIGARDNAEVGGIFRLDTRTGTELGGAQSFVVYGVATGGSTESARLIVNLQNGNTYLTPNGGNIIAGNGSGTFSLNSSNIDISSAGAITGATGFNGLVVTANTGVVTTGTWQGTAISSTYLDGAVVLSTEIDTSSELAGILGDETGFSSGALSVFSISPVITGTADFVAGDFSSTLTLSGTAANIALGSNWLSGDGGDEGVFVDASGNVGIGGALQYSEKFGLYGVQNSQLYALVRNTDVGSSAYSGYYLNANGNSWGMRMGSSAANANALQFDVDMLGTPSTKMIILAGGDIGIGRPDPQKRLDVFETVADAQLRVSYDGSNYTDFRTNSSGDLTIDASGGDVSLLDENFYVCSGGSCASTPNGAGTITAERAIVSEEGSLGTTGAITVNWDDGNQQRVNSSTGNMTFIFAHATAGQTLRLVVCYGGAHTITWSSTIRWAGGSAPTPTSTSSKCDVFSFMYTGTEYLGQPSLNF